MIKFNLIDKKHFVLPEKVKDNIEKHMYRMGSGKAKTQIVNAYYDKCHYKLGGQREFEAMQN